jgi:signal transduction histidine kinase
VIDAPSTYAVALWAVAAVCSCAAVYHEVLHRLDAGEPASRAFALGLVGLAAISLLTAYTASATDPAQAVRAQHLQVVAILGVDYFFARVFVGLAEARFPRGFGVYTWVMVGVAASGALFDPSEATGAYDWGPPHPDRRALAAWGIAPVLVVGSSFLILVPYAARLVRQAAGRDASRDLRLAASSLLIAILLGAVDIAGRLLGWAVPSFGGVTALLPVLGITNLLVGRAATKDRALSAKRRELGHSRDRMRSVEAALLRTEQVAAVGELSAVLASEMRGPLAVLDAVVDELTEGQGDEAQHLEALEAQVQRLDRMVEDLRAYRRPVVVEQRDVDLSALVRRVADGPSESVDVVEDGGAGVHTRGDPTLLRHALVHLLQRAVVERPGPHRLRCQVRAGRPTVELQHGGSPLDAIPPGGEMLSLVDRVLAVHEGSLETEATAEGAVLRLLFPAAEEVSAPAS